jgi:hypothetical protein
VLNPATVLTTFVLEKLDGEPLAKRAAIYRALAELSPNAAERRAFNSLASDCDGIEVAHAQLRFDFQQKGRR